MQLRTWGLRGGGRCNLCRRYTSHHARPRHRQGPGRAALDIRPRRWTEGTFGRQVKHHGARLGQDLSVSVTSNKVTGLFLVQFPVEFADYPVAAQALKDAYGASITQWRKTDRRETFCRSFGDLDHGEVRGMHIASAIRRSKMALRNRTSRSAVGSVETSRNPRAICSIVPHTCLRPPSVRNQSSG